MIEKYLNSILDTFLKGEAREESYYGFLKDFLIEFAQRKKIGNLEITILPKKMEAGNPDFKVSDNQRNFIGCIEAKNPETFDLDKIEKTAQISRYSDSFPNFLLTNFTEFRLYHEGLLIEKLKLCNQNKMFKEGKISLTEENLLFSLLDKFISYSHPVIYESETLATELAKRTRFLKYQILNEELIDLDDRKNQIVGFFEAFRKYLISDLTTDEFADIYAQTITYGLFAAKTRSNGKFTRRTAFDNIPKTIGILRDVFRFISLGDIPVSMELIIEEIVSVLESTDVSEILKKYYRDGKGSDPIIHFYETFLSVYDPQTRERRGVYYTPEPVVSYIVRSLHLILKEKFGLPDGFADRNVTVLDPAAGTLTFLAEAAKIAVEEFTFKYGEGAKSDFIKNHILKNFYAFELMMAPYAIGHLKMSFLLEELGYKLKTDDRFNLYLTNALEMEELEQTSLPGMVSLSEESHQAGKIKKEQRILVVMGNPPYSVSSANKSTFIEKEMELYKEDVKDEKNIQPLSDDYIKFIRYAHWKINKCGKGCIGMITNNSYLNGIIHRGMRCKIMNDFNNIYVVNLHGNSRIGEKCPDGSKDENVFEIQQGVAISIFVKKANGEKSVFYYDLFGQRSAKYAYLLSENINTTEYKKIKPSTNFHFFQDNIIDPSSYYFQFYSVNKIFTKYSSGVTTHRDAFIVAFTKEKLSKNIREMLKIRDHLELYRKYKLKNTKDFNIENTINLLEGNNYEKRIISYLYRPFDYRYICYFSFLIDRDRHTIMNNFKIMGNIGMAFMRQYMYERVKRYNYVFCVDRISDRRLFISNRGAGLIAPLYLYNDNNYNDLLNNVEESKIKSNIKYEFEKAIFNVYDINNIEQIFYYIYAILYSNIYRTKYAEFLKIDFPRIPFTKNKTLFRQFAEFGKRLTDLHLLRSNELERTYTKFSGVSDNYKISDIDYKKDKLYINKDKYFEGIEPDIWNYQIGGYQVINRWLSYRKGRDLNTNDVQHICRTVTALQKTIDIQNEIDQIYPEIEKNIIEFQP